MKIAHVCRESGEKRDSFVESLLTIHKGMHFIKMDCFCNVWQVAFLSEWKLLQLVNWWGSHTSTIWHDCSWHTILLLSHSCK